VSELLLNDLRSEIARGRVLAIVGAGVSIAATQGNPFAGWSGLLHDGVDRCEAVGYPKPRPGWGERQHAALRSGDLGEWLGVAEDVEHRLKKAGEFSRWVRETVGRLSIKEPKVLEAVVGLGMPIMTTNYDDLLGESAALPAVTLHEPERVLRVLRREERAILHLHGHWKATDSIVLGVRSYERHVSNGRIQDLQKSLLIYNSLLFIGCGLGLDDPNFGCLREWLRTVLGGEHRHYRLCRSSELKDLENQRKEFDRLFPVDYGGEHDSLVEFLHGLAPSMGKAPAAHALRSVVQPSGERGKRKLKGSAGKRSAAPPGSWEAAKTGMPRVHGAGGPYAKTQRHIAYGKLADVAINKPPQGSTPEDFEVIPDLSFGVARVSERSFKADIGLKVAKLVYEGIGCHVKANTRYGQNPQRSGVATEGVQWIFTPVDDPEGVLRGSPPGMDVLARMEGDGTRLPSVTIFVECDRDTDIAILIRSQSANLTRQQERVIARFLQKCAKLPDGSMRLGWAKLSWEDNK
jgi:SIR2-like domain